MTDNIFVKNKSVLLRGPAMTSSGYGVHCRQIASWLLSKNDIDLSVQALPWGDTPWLIDKNSCGGLIGRIMEKTSDVSGKHWDVSVQLQLPNEWDRKLANVNIGVTAGVESDKCNPQWIDACNSMSAVVVPSKHAEACFRNTGNVNVPIFVIPEAYSQAIDDDKITNVDSAVFSTPFNFLIFGQLTGNNPENDRKNIFYAVKWLCETFANDKDVGIIIKTNAGRSTTFDRRAVVNLFTTLLSEVRKGEFPRVHLLHGDMTDEEVASLYRHKQIKALVAPTRGEGYGLPILEAAASGLPVIATSWSGHTDFLSLGKYIGLDYKLDYVHQTRVDGKIFMQGSKWANPLEEDFKKKLLKFRNSNSIPTEWAVDLKNKIKQTYSLDCIKNRYDEILGKYL